METVFDIFLLINFPLIIWAVLTGIYALMKGWPKMSNKGDKIYKQIFIFYVWIVSIIVWLLIIVGGYNQLESIYLQL